MNDPRPELDFQDLLAHADWVRAVARKLVSDAVTAEDVVQDTWVAALRRPPEGVGNLRAWLGRVVFNQVRQKGRGEGRRRRREEEAARPEGGPSLDELAQRAALQRDVVDRVLELDEPFRSVVLLRFFEDLTPPQIARRLGIPLKTVHSRLQRAFQRLRERLDREYGDTKSWCVAWMPLITVRQSAPLGATSAVLTTAGAWIVNANVKIGLAVAAALLGGFGVWSITQGDSGADVIDSPGRSASTVAAAPRSGGNVEIEAPRGTIETPAARELVASSVSEPDPIPEPSPTAVVRGRAVNMSGAPLVGVSVVLEREDSPLARTDSGGLFEVVLEDPGQETWDSSGNCLRVQDEDWVTVRQSCVRLGNVDMEHIVVAAPAKRLEGWVEDQDGNPIQDATISLSRQGEAFFGFPYALDLTRWVDPEVATDDGGGFVFERFPDARGLRLYAFAEGFLAAGVDLDEASWPVVVRLTRLEESDRSWLEGIVIDDHGFAVEGAQVQLSESRATTDRTGFFRVGIRWVEPTTALCAGKAGSLPAVIPDFGRIIEAAGGRPEPVELVLGGTPLEVHGRVVDERGEPCVNWIVSAMDELEVSQNRIPVDTAEGYARGDTAKVRTDADGRFTLTGLFDREYRVQAYQERTLFRTEASVRAGDRDVLLEARREVREDVHGLVVDSRGEPVGDVRLALVLDVVKTDCCRQTINGAVIVTGESGSFEFDSVPVRHAYLSYSGDRILPGSMSIPEEELTEPLRLEVVQRCHFRVELNSHAQLARTAEVLDADGRRLQVNRFTAGGQTGMPRVRLEEGRSEVLSVSELAAEIVLQDEAGNELARQAIQLEPDRVNVLEL